MLYIGHWDTASGAGETLPQVGAGHGLAWAVQGHALAIRMGVDYTCTLVTTLVRKCSVEAHKLVTLEPNPKVAAFQPGDTVKVNVWIREGSRQRLQAFQGVVIRKRAGGPSSSFTVRRTASGIGVERSFLLYSPNLESVEVQRRGKVRRAKLYHLRGLSGKAARIKERQRSSS